MHICKARLSEEERLELVLNYPGLVEEEFRVFKHFSGSMGASRGGKTGFGLELAECLCSGGASKDGEPGEGRKRRVKAGLCREPSSHLAPLSRPAQPRVSHWDVNRIN